MRSLELYVLCTVAITTPFITSVLAATTETTEGGLASWYYVTQSLTYGDYEAEGLSFYVNCKYERLLVAVSTNGQSKHNGTAFRTQFASGPLRLATPACLEMSDMEVYVTGDVESRVRFYTSFHTGTPIMVKMTGADS